MLVGRFRLLDARMGVSHLTVVAQLAKQVDGKVLVGRLRLLQAHEMGNSHLMLYSGGCLLHDHVHTCCICMPVAILQRRVTRSWWTGALTSERRAMSSIAPEQSIMEMEVCLVSGSGGREERWDID